VFGVGDDRRGKRHAMIMPFRVTASAYRLATIRSQLGTGIRDYGALFCSGGQLVLLVEAIATP
jgi:hypothetical protein